eukprot:2546081-Pyramimonas_sp.AAC.1
MHDGIDDGTDDFIDDHMDDDVDLSELPEWDTRRQRAPKDPKLPHTKHEQPEASISQARHDQTAASR